MQPLGRRPTRFPGKEDCKPPKPFCNWWEIEYTTESKAAENRRSEKEIEEGVKEWQAKE